MVVDDLCEVNDALLDIASKWYMLGLQLRIGPGMLDTIDEKYSKNPNKCLLEVLKDWLKKGEASWEKVIEALESRAVGETGLARKLKEKYSIGALDIIQFTIVHCIVYCICCTIIYKQCVYLLLC